MKSNRSQGLNMSNENNIIDAKSKNKLKNELAAKTKDSKDQRIKQQQINNHEDERNHGNQIKHKSLNKYGELEKDKQQLSSKVLRTEFDKIESLLKNRDLSAQQLAAIVTQKLLDQLVHAFYEYVSLEQQIARIILQIYSHYPVKHLLYNKSSSKLPENSKYKKISYIVVPLMFNVYKSVNQLAALQCVQGVIGEGNLNILEVLKLPAVGGRRENEVNLTLEGTIDKNIECIVREWANNCNSIFIGGVLEIIHDNLRMNFQAIADNRKISMSGNSINSKGSHKSTIEIESEKILMSLVTQLTQCVVAVEYCSHNLKIENKSLENIFKLYVDYGCHSLSLPALKQTKFIEKYKPSQHKQKIETEQKQYELLFKWALYSTCESIHYTNSAGRKKKIKNSSKQIFVQIMSYIQLLINKTKIEKKQSTKNETSHKRKKSRSENNFDLFMQEQRNQNQNKQQVMNNTKIHHIINFIFSLFYPYSTNKRPNEFKLIVLIKYSELFLHLINNVNIEDNVQEEYIQTIILCIFHVAIFCDEFKKKHKLQTLLQQVQEMGILSDQMPGFFEFDVSQSVLYRLLISIQKSLPRYSLKYYDFLYIERPGIFHLYFMNQILNQRNPTEVTQFLVYLVERWIRVQMRDFNVLGYICKFITHFLTQSQRSTEQNLKTLLIFFRSLSDQALIYLNAVFYQSSFSEISSASYTYSQHNRKSILPSSSKFNENSNSASVASNNDQVESIILPTFTFALPPLTLCSFQQQSQIKSCGYSYTDKSLFIDKNFCIGQQMLRWSILLYEINDDEFYYNCKYFYFLLTTSYNKKQSLQKKGRNSKLFEEENVTFRELSKNLSKKIDKILEIWEESILKNKTTLVHSIFQIIMCWSTYTLSNSNENDNQIMSKDQLKKVLNILLEHSQKLIKLPAIFAKNWREALKQMQINNQLLENYKKQESKVKNKQLYFMRSISIFFQNISTRICSLAPKSKSYQQILQIIESYSPYTGGFTCWRSYRLLSEKMSRNFFIEQSIKILNQSKEIGDFRMGQCIFTRRKLQVYRQIMFAFIEQDTLKINNETQNRKQYSQSMHKYSQNSKISQSSQKSHTKNIEQMSQFELKTKINDIVKFCIEVFAHPIANEITTNESINVMKTDINIMKNDKQQLYNKFLALEIIQQFFNNCIANKSCLNLLHKLEQKSSREKRKLVQNKQCVIEPLRNSIIKVLFRDRTLITKYQRRLILHFRSACLNWVAGRKSMLLHLYLKENKQSMRNNLVPSGNNKINCFLNIHEISLILWHLVMDEQIQLRIQVISILANNFKYENFSLIQSQIIYVSAILTLVVCLEPKLKVKLFAAKIVNIIWSKFVESKNQACDFLLKLVFTIGSLIYNSKTSIPSLDIFDTFCNLWMRNNKDNYYIIICALEQLDSQNYKFKKIQILQDASLGIDLKNYYVNVKTKKGWINVRDQSIVEEKTQTIFKHIKMVIADKNKHAKFLKSKKQILFEMSQFVKHPEMMPLIERMSEIQIKNRQNKQYSSQHINFTLREPSDQSTQNQNNDCDEKNF